MSDLRRLAENVRALRTSATVSAALVEALADLRAAATDDALLALYARLDALTARLREHMVRRHSLDHCARTVEECQVPCCVADRALLEGRDG